MLATGIPRSFARNWKLVNSLMSLVFPQRRECGANHHKQKFHATRGEALQRRATPMGNSGRRPRRTRRSKQRVGRGFAGGKAQRDGWNRDSWPYEYSRLMASSVVNLCFAKTLADFEMNDLAALPALFCYNS